MAKRNHDSSTSPCKCNLCGVTAKSMPNTTHRRCTGNAPLPDVEPTNIRPKHDLIAGTSRGTWTT